MTQPPQDPGDAPYGGAYQQPPPGQAPYGPSGEQPGQGPYGIPQQRPYTEPAPAASYAQPIPPYPPPGPPPYGQPGPSPFDQPGPSPYGQPAQQPFGSPYPAYPAYPAQPGGYQGKDPNLAEWWQRLLARVIDWIAATALTAVLWVPAVAAWIHRLRQIALQYPDTSTPAAQAALNRAGTILLRDILALALVSVAVSFCYDWLQHARWGQTLGKRALGTMVVTAAGRSKISGWAAADRAAVFILAPAVPIVGGIFSLLDDLWLLWDPSRQCLHDKAASTVVVKTRAPAAPARQPGAW